ncbi:axoneme-associated protein mst101(2) [Drosophila pseudoobscura]|uniref:Axoneme-associated protein mst101(2) n=1 Tax=Drosophila pseudoobscura pseudoobscura TaxID=46245 RepID=A0A6I8UT08_DROPS|nr:axoneme-associated protein mst101(2) [Drosophila pseudoobscura]
MVFWKKITSCITKGAGGHQNGGGSGPTRAPKQQLMNMADMLQRVPPNQLPQFQMFKRRNEEYRRRVNKYPDSMPKIDWEYYRKNVRPEFVSWVSQFEQKYDKLDTLFVNRHVMISSRRYFEEVNKEAEEMQREICEYKEESDKRIGELNKQLDVLKAMMPYEDMTMEEFCQQRPHLAPDFINKPTFWPHTPEEQTPGPSDPTAVHPEEPEEPPKAPPKPPAAAPPPTAAAKPEGATPDAKKPTEISASPKKEETSKAVEEMTEKAAETAKELAIKVQQLLTIAVAKISQMVKQVHEAAAAARAAKTAKPKPQEAAETPKGSALAKPRPKAKEVAEEDDDHYHRREHSPNICTQTIIRGEEAEQNPEVKAKHVNLSIEGDEEEDDWPEEKRKKCEDLECKRKSKGRQEDAHEDEDEDIPCKEQKKEEASCRQREKEESLEKDCEERQKCEAEESERECETESKAKKQEKIQFEDAAKADFAVSISTCEPVQKTSKTDKKGTKDPCKPQEKASLNPLPEGPSSRLKMGLKDMEIFSPDQSPKEAPQIGDANEADAPAAPQRLKDSTITYPRLEIVPKSKKTQPKPQAAEVEKVTSDDAAKRVFDMATDAASLLSDATISEEEAEKLKCHRIETLEAAYRSAHKQANRALVEAFKAVDAARKLAKRSRSSSESQFRDHNDQAMAEKHALLAKLLAKRAVALKQEIAKVLEKLKNKD